MAKRKIEPIRIGNLYLRLLTEADLPTTLAWRNQDEVRKWFLYSECITPEQHAAWFTAYLERDNDFVFIIELIEDNSHPEMRPVGQVALYNIDWQTGTAEFGRLMIGDFTARGHGVARCATETLLDYGANVWGLQEYNLDVLTENRAAIAIYERIGFIRVAHSDFPAAVIHMRRPSSSVPHS